MRGTLLSLLSLLSLLLLGAHGFGGSLRCLAQSRPSSFSSFSSFSSSFSPSERAFEIERLRRGPTVPPPNFKVAMFGDQGLGEAAEAVMRKLRDEGVDLIVHSGDNDYDNNPEAWEAQINRVLGEDFPYFSSIGNHDSLRWGVKGGYQDRIAARMARLNATSYCTGEVGVKYACNFQGLLFVTSGVGSRELGHPEFFEEVFEGSQNIWRMVTWHKNQRLYQCGGKFNAVGYDVYDTGRKHGAIISTSHEHSYSRTHLMSDFSTQEIASKDPTIVLSEGKSFAFVSGLGGRSIREYKFALQRRPWWAATAAKDDNVNYGALVCTLHINGDPRQGECIFEDLDGVVWDKFSIYTNVTGISQDSGLPCTPRFIEVGLESTQDDSTQDLRLNRGGVVYDEKVLALGGERLTALRFTSHGLEKGSRISDVHLQFLGAEDGNTLAPITIRGLKGYPDGSDGVISILETTKASVTWLEEDDDWEAGNIWVSPDLKEIVDELVSDQAWEEGVPLSFVISGPGHRRVYSSDQDPCFAPSLTIEFESPCH